MHALLTSTSPEFFRVFNNSVYIMLSLLEQYESISGGTTGGTGGTYPPKFRKLAKIVKEKWHGIKLGIPLDKKIISNLSPPPTRFRFFRAGAATGKFVNFLTQSYIHQESKRNS